MRVAAFAAVAGLAACAAISDAAPTKWRAKDQPRVMKALHERWRNVRRHLKWRLTREGDRSYDFHLHVALGFNVCVDRVARLVPVMSSVGELASSELDLNSASEDALRLAAGDANSSMVSSLPELALLVQKHMGDGAAAERVMAPGSGFDSLLSAAASASAQSRDRLGGNAALMAKEMARLGPKVLLAGPMGPRTEALIGSSMKTVTATKPTAPGEAASSAADDTHLILEYATGETWRKAVAPRANRFIVTQDSGLSETASLDALLDIVEESGSGSVPLTFEGFPADAVVVAGLHMLEQLPEAEWRAKLSHIAHRVRVLPFGISAHLELASVATPRFMEAMAAGPLSSADSLGMNEQELADLFEAVGGAYAVESPDERSGRAARYDGAFPLQSYDDPMVPSRASLTGGRTAAGRHFLPVVHSCLSAARFVMARLPALSRLHLHTLGFQAIMTATPPSPRFNGTVSHWGSAYEAAAAAATTATARACGRDVPQLRDDDFEILVDRKVEVADLALRGAMDRAGFTATAKKARKVMVGPFHHRAAGRMWDIAFAKPVGFDPSSPVVSGALARDPHSTVGVIVTDFNEEPNPKNAENASERWVHYAVVPVPVCRKPRSTVGLGDAVSAAGLVAHLGKRFPPEHILPNLGMPGMPGSPEDGGVPDMPSSSRGKKRGKQGKARKAARASAKPDKGRDEL
ncbi:hypothetical protein FNF29_04154 [Cafeteria roenbergensis]|uniref:Carbohydrate kinase PfkB domain-containing protein n=1 Tax=Cafeteria roenbergensis TaxID=33653 RepID=A0A5A8CIT5_CAFRO|nr:hypothetical protein FNF29_04154 [Cafeteria roenbergensis]|eukprot:KAA0152040.1 hypothetical protein FNF29_04154 [Cafeteria roenbergensis]